MSSTSSGTPIKFAGLKAAFDAAVFFKQRGHKKLPRSLEGGAGAQYSQLSLALF